MRYRVARLLRRRGGTGAATEYDRDKRRAYGWILVFSGGAGAVSWVRHLNKTDHAPFHAGHVYAALALIGGALLILRNRSREPRRRSPDPRIPRGILMAVVAIGGVWGASVAAQRAFDWLGGKVLGGIGWVATFLAVLSFAGWLFSSLGEDEKREQPP